jgi:hypothetical protein
VLPLDDPRWATLTHAFGAATDVPGWLRSLAAGKDVWQPLWSALCDDAVYPATYAAVPHLVDIAATLPPRAQLPFWTFVAEVARTRAPAPIPKLLDADYHAAIPRARKLAFATLDARVVDEREAAVLLAALAALAGHPTISHALEALADDDLAIPCPDCEALVPVSLEHTPLLPAKRRPRPLPFDAITFARRAAAPRLATRLAAWDGTVACPTCARRFVVRDALIDAPRR